MLCWLWHWSCNGAQKRSEAGNLQHCFPCYGGTCGVVGFGAGGFLALSSPPPTGSCGFGAVLMAAALARGMLKAITLQPPLMVPAWALRLAHGGSAYRFTWGGGRDSGHPSRGTSAPLQRGHGGTRFGTWSTLPQFPHLRNGAAQEDKGDAPSPAEQRACPHSPHPCIWRHPHIPPHLGPQPQLVNGVFSLGVLGQQLVVVVLWGAHVTMSWGGAPWGAQSCHTCTAGVDVALHGGGVMGASLSSQGIEGHRETGALHGVRSILGRGQEHP